MGGGKGREEVGGVLPAQEQHVPLSCSLMVALEVFTLSPRALASAYLRRGGRGQGTQQFASLSADLLLRTALC